MWPSMASQAGPALACAQYLLVTAETSPCCSLPTSPCWLLLVLHFLLQHVEKPGVRRSKSRRLNDSARGKVLVVFRAHACCGTRSVDALTVAGVWHLRQATDAQKPAR